MVAGRYRLVESIGQGGMGRVWRAADEMLDRLVAVKEMRIDGLDAEDARTRRERTLREARATARIDHPNVVRVYDVVDEGERLWIVMELVAGRSLERMMMEDGPLGPQQAARIGIGLVTALRQVHARGVLHRDIKPGNVLVEANGHRVVLTDFGIAAIQDAKALTMVGMLVGSPDYMAPERIAGRPQGPPSDIWSLGATLCAALAGHSPFSRDTTLATLHAVLYEEPQLPATAGALRSVLAALLEKEPELRPGLDEVEEALHPTAFPAPTPTVQVGPEEEPPPHPEDERPLPDPPTPAFPWPRRELPTPPFLNTPQPPPAPAPTPEPTPAPTWEPAPTPTPDRAPAAAVGAQPPQGPPAPDHESRTGGAGGNPDRAEGPVPTHNASSEAHGGISLIRSEAVTEQRPTPRPSPHPSSHPSSHPHRRTRLLTAAALTTAAAVITTLILLNANSPGTNNEAQGTPTPTASTPTAPTSPPSTVEGTSRPQSLPPGAHREAGGFAWATPKDWRRDVKTGAEVHYTSPDGTQELAAKSSLARGDLMDTWKTSEQNAHQGQDYRKIRLEDTEFQGHPAVVWEYTFMLKGVPWHARLLGFNAGGKSYQVNTWYQPQTETQALKTYEKVKKSFTVL
ncbi:serine/threonine protein kinase [Streptomyces sp. NBC_00028]|uniref:serine/threonine-protein kinase n=1 Tax=Streptomyces sp. NBC_00028 TaxID=2975624 RepID=UPI0032554EFF